MRDLNKIKGCLLGGAVGDALGYAVEFMRLKDIVETYGEQGITRYELTGGAARISDDTQMSLFTANALLFGETKRRTQGEGAGPLGYFREAYLDWYATQTRRYPLPESEARICWLMNCKELFSRRAPGNTCMTALAEGGHGTVERPVNHSKGCGGVMRVAPIGVYLAGKPLYSAADAARAGAEASAITHGHELGYIPSAALVHMIYTFTEAETPDLLSAVRSSLEAVRGLFPQARHMDEFDHIMDKAIALSARRSDSSARAGWRRKRLPLRSTAP